MNLSIQMMPFSPESLPDSEHEEAALGAVDGALADELVEALRVELPAHLADARLPRLPLLQLLVQLLLDTWSESSKC